MTCTWDPALTTDRDKVRLRLGDTATPTGCLKPDETIDALLLSYDVDATTAILAESLAIEYAQHPDSMSGDGASISYRNRVDQWNALAERARADAAVVAGSGVGPTTTVSRRSQRWDDDAAEYRRPEWATACPPDIPAYR